MLLMHPTSNIEENSSFNISKQEQSSQNKLNVVARRDPQ
jgi:hypothetical protein